MTELTCIICPKGCRLKIEEENGFSVTGNSCDRGVTYAKEELTNPKRVLTSTVRLEGACLRRLPVKTSCAIPKSSLFSVIKQLNAISVQAPVHVGDVLLENVCGSGAHIVATKTVAASLSGRLLPERRNARAGGFSHMLREKELPPYVVCPCQGSS